MRTPQTVASATAFIKSHHLIIYRQTVIMPIRMHCEACGEPLIPGQTAYLWQSSDAPLTFRLDGYCDVIAFRLTKQFLVRLKRAIYNPNEDIVGWPARPVHNERNDNE